MLRPPQPAHATKHLPYLNHQFHKSSFKLAQSDAGDSNGTALWLGAQCLSAFLLHQHSTKRTRQSHPRLRAIELGAGIGLSALALASLGYNCLCTDVPAVLPLLRQNVAQNLTALPPDSGSIDVRELDWTVPPNEWDWAHPHAIASPRIDANHSADSQALGLPFDLIITADTLYSPALTTPLLRTLHALLSLSTSPSHIPQAYIALERRDPALIDAALKQAEEDWGMMLKRVPHRRVAKALEKAAIKWAREDWDGVEIWEVGLAAIKLDSTDAGVDDDAT